MRSSNPAWSRIRCISFDADGTLFDLKRAIQAALTASLHTIQNELGGCARSLTVADLVRIREAVAQRMPQATHEAIRQRAFAATLAQLGAPDERLAAALCEAYLQDRFRLCCPYDDVLPCLMALRGRYGLGIISNGNSYPERCGLPGMFAWVVLAQEVGAKKPEARIFATAVQRAGCRPGELLHVGDDLIEDIAGAQRAGLQAAWLNRAQVACPPELPAGAELQSLAELTLLLE